MTGRVYLHVGPPKTATTSLQTAMEAIEHSGYAYAGVLQPRDRNSGTLANLLHKATLGDDGAAASLVERLRAEVSRHELVVISEEMLSLEQNGISTADKIEKIGTLLAEFEVVPVVTLRDPRKGLPSLFQEIHAGLPLGLQLSFAAFCASGYAKCYDYGALKDLLAAIGFGSARWLDFTRITQGALTTGDVFGSGDLWNDARLSVPRLNVSVQSASGERELPRVSARAIGRNPLVRRVIDGMGLRGTRLTRTLGGIADRLSLDRMRSPALEVPEDCLNSLLPGYLAIVRETQDRA